MANHHFIIVDDHPLFRDALKLTLKSNFADLQITEAGSLEGLISALEQSAEPDLVLLDLSMPGVHGFSGLVYLRAHAPTVPVIVISGNDNPSIIRKCIEFGASGFIPKSSSVEDMRNGITAVLEGRIWTPKNVNMEDSTGDANLAAKLASLTPQQVKVLMMLGEGLLNKQIAYQLQVSEATVKAHVSAILHKLGVDSRTQAVIAIGKMESL